MLQPVGTGRFGWSYAGLVERCESPHQKCPGRQGRIEGVFAATADALPTKPRRTHRANRSHGPAPTSQRTRARTPRTERPRPACRGFGRVGAEGGKGTPRPLFSSDRVFCADPKKRPNIICRWDRTCHAESRLSSPAGRAAMGTSEEPLRQRICRGADCGVVFWICRHCDRGH